MRTDFRMLAGVASFFALLLAFVGMLAWRTQQHRPGGRRWVVANLLFAVSLPLLVLRSVLGDWIGVVVANGLIVAASILSLEGVRKYRNRKTDFRAVYACGALALASVAYFNYVTNSVSARVVIMSSFMGIVTASCSATLLRDKPVGRWPAIMAGLFGFSAAIETVRAIYFFFAPPLSDLFSLDPVNIVFFAGVALSIGCCSFGWAGLAADHLGENLRQAESLAATVRREAAGARVEAESLALRAAEAQASPSEYMALANDEIRNPLGGILAVMDLLTDTEAVDQRECADIVRAQVEKILSVNDNLLDLSTLEAGRMTIEATPFDLRLLVEEVARQCSAAAARNGLDLVVVCQDQFARRFLGDATRIRQVLLNLVGNAVTVAKEGQVEIAAECDLQDGKNAKIRVSVTRTRAWIAPEEAGSLLVTFKPAPVSALHRYGSIGISLAVSKRLVELMDGYFHLENQPGRGSRMGFTLTLPIEAHEAT
jgi:signal transduction histidine kinase